MINKKALSTIVSVVIVMAISISLAFMVSSVINSSFKLKLAPEINCASLQIESPISIQSACYNSETSEVELTLHRTFNTPSLSDLTFSLSSEQSEITRWQCGSTCGGCDILEEGEKRTYYLDSQSSAQRINVETQGCLLNTKDISPC